jgi:hypothetical protein
LLTARSSSNTDRWARFVWRKRSVRVGSRTPAGSVNPRASSQGRSPWARPVRTREEKSLVTSVLAMPSPIISAVHVLEVGPRTSRCCCRQPCMAFQASCRPQPFQRTRLPMGQTCFCRSTHPPNQTYGCSGSSIMQSRRRCLLHRAISGTETSLLTAVSLRTPLTNRVDSRCMFRRPRVGEQMRRHRHHYPRAKTAHQELTAIDAYEPPDRYRSLSGLTDCVRLCPLMLVPAGRRVKCLVEPRQSQGKLRHHD